MNDETRRTNRSVRTLPATARDLYRRGAGAVARTGGDNVGLALLAVGAAAGAIGWLVARGRAANRRHGR